MESTYDPACYELAESFLADHPAINNPATADSLAWRIQQTIEDFIAAEEP